MTEERKIYMEKKNTIHTHEEILAAFDGNDLLVTVRHLSQADHEKKENSED